MSNTKTIAKNTGWYGLENIINIVLSAFTSIAIARTLGPTRMGYIIYVSWIASVVGSLGGLGIPATTRKYMAEFLVKGDRGTARYIYMRTLMLQAGLATLVTLTLMIWVLSDAAGDYKLASALIVLSIWPLMVNAISSQANVASEELSKNMPASAISVFSFFVMIVLTMLFHWGVVGVGASMLVMRLADFLVRIVPTMRGILSWTTTHVQPEGLSNRMFTFAWQSVAVLVLEMIVWQRSEFILLKHLCSDIRQVAFYSVAFSMAENLLMSASIFSSAAGATVFAQFGRDKSRIPELTATTIRYLALTSIPLHFISAALAAPAMMLLYGRQYEGAIAVVTIAPLLCMPKAFLGPVRSLLQSHERQSLVIGATIFAGIVDIATAWVLIIHHGAVGACIGSGAAEITAVVILWAFGIYLYKVELHWDLIAKVTFISTVAALAAHAIAARLHPLLGVALGGFASLTILAVLFYVMRVLNQQDGERFAVMSRMLPKRIETGFNRALSWLIRPN